MQYFEYKTPPVSKIKGMGYKYPTKRYPSLESQKVVDEFLLSSLNNGRHRYKKLKDMYHYLWASTAATKSCVAVYAYYLDNPEKFNHEPDNIVGHIMRAATAAVAAYHKKYYGSDGYITLSNALVTKYKEKVMAVLYKDAERVRLFKQFREVDYVNHPTHEAS